MGRLLNELKAGHAKSPAKLSTAKAVDSQDSQLSQGFDAAEIRARLLGLAELLEVDEQQIRKLTAAELAEYATQDDVGLVAYLEAMQAAADRQAGRVPVNETATIHCRHCGPVWATPDIAECLPVDSGWPRALGCPWCLPKSRSFPRPSVCCEGCRHFRPDSINPPAGLGSCSAGHGVYYPKQAHVCAYFQPDISED